MEWLRRLPGGAREGTAGQLALWCARAVIVLSMALIAARALEVPLRVPQNGNGAAPPPRAAVLPSAQSSSLPQLDVPPASAFPALTAPLPTLSSGKPQGGALAPLERAAGSQLARQLPGVRGQVAGPLRPQPVVLSASPSRLTLSPTAQTQPIGSPPAPSRSSDPTGATGALGPSPAPSSAPTPGASSDPRPTPSPSQPAAFPPPASPAPSPGPAQQPPPSPSPRPSAQA